MLFTGCWDKQIRALMLDTGEVDKTWIGSKAPIKIIKVHENCIFVSGMDPVIRSFNLDTGEVKQYEGHSSWVLCMETYVTYDDLGK